MGNLIRNILILLLISLMISCTKSENIALAESEEEVDIVETPDPTPSPEPTEEPILIPTVIPTSEIIPEEAEVDPFALADCEMRCEDHPMFGQLYKRQCLAHSRLTEKTYWIYRNPDDPLKLDRAFEGGAELLPGDLALPECSGGVRCSEAPDTCLDRCSCIIEDPEFDCPEETDSAYTMSIYIDVMQKMLFLCDNSLPQGERRVMSIRVATGANDATPYGDFIIGKFCMDDQYCSTYTPENFPQDMYRHLWPENVLDDYQIFQFPKHLYYKGNSFFINSCGLNDEDFNLICGDMGPDVPLLCNDRPGEVLPEDWYEQIQEVNCDAHAHEAFASENRGYVAQDANGYKFAYPGPFGIVKGNLFRRVIEDGQVDYVYTPFALHGTNERELLGYSETHGCVRGFSLDIFNVYKYIQDRLRSVDTDDYLDYEDMKKVIVHIREETNLIE